MLCHGRLLLLRFPHRTQHIRERRPTHVSVLSEPLGEEVFQLVRRRPPHVHSRLNLSRLGKCCSPVWRRGVLYPFQTCCKL